MTGSLVTEPAGEGACELGKQGERDEQLAQAGLLLGCCVVQQCSAVLHGWLLESCSCLA